jgi:hypothetical protein
MDNPDSEGSKEVESKNHDEENVDESKAAESKPNQNDQDQSSTKTVDPIKWFGILVPEALRQTQKHFSEAVESPLPRVANVIRQMRQLENEIGRQRKAVKKVEKS